MRWEAEDEEVADVGENTTAINIFISRLFACIFFMCERNVICTFSDGEGLHFIVALLSSSSREEQRMLVISATHCLLCSLQTGQVEERRELRLLTSVRREEDGLTLAVAFRCADPAMRSRRVRFGEAADCERCRAELANHLMAPSAASSAPENAAGGGGGGGGGWNVMHCFRCRNRIDADKVARVMELDPSTGERMLVPACPHCGYKALAAEDAPMEEKASMPIASPISSSLASSVMQAPADSPDSRGNPALATLTRLSASSSTTSSSLARVPCDWILFDRSNFAEFDHQIKRHFDLHVLTLDNEECRLHLKVRRGS